MNKEESWRHLKELVGETNETVRLAYHVSPRGRWVYTTIGSEDNSLAYNHRSVLPTEVVLDLDAATEEENFEALKKVSLRLKSLGVKHTVWSTGGKGYHIHTFWNRLDTVKETKLMKDLIGDWLVWKTGAKIDKQLMGNHLVRMEHGYYEKTYPADNYKKPMGDNTADHFQHNEIPKDIWDSYAMDILKWALKRLRPRQKTPFGGMPLCMRHIMSPEFKDHKDGAKRALFIIASYHRNLDDDKVMEILREFNNYMLNEPYTERQLRFTLKSVRKHKGRPVGCHYRHSLLEEIGAKDVVKMCENGYNAKK